MSKKTLGLIIIFLGIISGVVFFVSGNLMGSTGSTMTDLQSQAGNTVAEAYYQNVGQLAKGISIFIYALGMTTITFSVGFGGKLIIQDKFDKAMKDQSSKIQSSIGKSDMNLSNTETFEDLPEL